MHIDSLIQWQWGRGEGERFLQNPIFGVGGSGSIPRSALRTPHLKSEPPHVGCYEVHGKGQDEGEPTIVLIPLINCSSRRPYSTKFLLVSASEALELASCKTTTMCGSMEMPPS